MTDSSLFFSSGFDGWCTPPEVLELVARLAPEGIAMDPASQAENPTQADEFCYEGGPDGLTTPWPETGLVFCNPPYGRALAGWSTRMANHRGEGLYLVPSRTETRWWGRLYGWADWALLWSSPSRGSRIKFVDPRREDGYTRRNATFPSTLFYKGPRAALFTQVFREHGRLLPGKRTLESVLSLASRSL